MESRLGGIPTVHLGGQAALAHLGGQAGRVGGYAALRGHAVLMVWADGRQP